MRNAEQEVRMLQRVAVVLVAAVAEALADQPGAPSARKIVVSIPDRMVALVENGRVVRTYPAAVGAPATPTPPGACEVTHRIPHPTWYTRAKVVPPGKANPLGTRWIGLSLKGYGIHGTNNPNSIGRRASHGCVRLRNADVEDLFERVSLGDTVELHDRPSVELDRIFGTQLAAVTAGAQ